MNGDFLRDKFVVGIRRDYTRRPLLVNENLTLQKVIEIIQTDELVDKDNSYFKNHESSRETPVPFHDCNQVHSNSTFVRKTNTTSKRVCMSCRGYNKSKTEYENCFAES